VDDRIDVLTRIIHEGAEIDAYNAAIAKAPDFEAAFLYDPDLVGS
jgi:hypothetical protein